MQRSDEKNQECRIRHAMNRSREADLPCLVSPVSIDISCSVELRSWGIVLERSKWSACVLKLLLSSRVEHYLWTYCQWKFRRAVMDLFLWASCSARRLFREQNCTESIKTWRPYCINNVYFWNQLVCILVTLCRSSALSHSDWQYVDIDTFFVRSSHWPTMKTSSPELSPRCHDR
jgi:hypothetical protein